MDGYHLKKNLRTKPKTNDLEQDKFCNIVGTCASGFVATIVTGNPAPVFSAIINSIFPLIARSRAEQPAMPLAIAVITPAEPPAQT